MARIVAKPETSAQSGARRWTAPGALVIALIAVALAVWALLKPAPEQTTSATTTSQQSGDPKARACSAYNTVGAVVSLQTHNNPGTDPALIQAVAANSPVGDVRWRGVPAEPDLT